MDHKNNERKHLIRNSTAEFMIFTDQASEPCSAKDETPTSERQT